MSNIQPKKQPVLKKGVDVYYDPATFATNHKVKNFVWAKTADEILERVQPFTLMGRKFITFDTETHPFFLHSRDVPTDIVRRWVGTGKKAVPQDYPFCISICDGAYAYSLLDSHENGFKEFKKLSTLLADESVEKIAHNTKFDMHMLANINLRLKGRIHDTIVLAKIVNENRFNYMLKKLADKLDGGITKFEYMVDAYKQMSRISDYRQIPKELLIEYANADVWNAMLLFKEEYPKLEAENLTQLYDTECEVMVALYEMERYGMCLNREYEEPLKTELTKLTNEAEEAIYAEAGKMFNINSGKQLYEILMGLGVPDRLIGRTEKGNPQLNKSSLENLARHNVNIVKNILDYRKYSKLLTTYAIGIYSQHDMANRVHGSINQTEATTGRMSITKPALQTLPKKDKRIRKAFVPASGFKLVMMDLDQVEYRFFAHYAHAEGLLQAIREGYDVHAATAAMLTYTELPEFVAKLQAEDKEAVAWRSKGKTVNFALIYGVGIRHLGEMLDVSVTEASDIKRDYFAQLPEANQFIQMVHNAIRVRGFVRNFYGRRRRLPVDSCYKAPNALIQGCAADYLKAKIVLIYKYLKYHDLKTRLINVVHDEVVLEVAEDELHHLGALRWLLSEFDTFRCPITAGVDMGDLSWGEKVSCPEVEFVEPKDKAFMDYNVYNNYVLAADNT